MQETLIRHSSDITLGKGQILFLEPESSKHLSLDDFEVFQDRFSHSGFKLIYLPYVFQNIGKEILDYFLPEGNLDFSPVQFQNRFMEENGISLNSPAAIRQVDDELFLIQSNEQDESSEVFLELLWQHLKAKSASNIRIFCAIALPDDSRKKGELSASYSSIPIKGEEYDIESLILELQKLKEARLRELGLSESALRFILGKPAPLYSRLVITQRANIYLPDYGNREIKMDDKTKALYFLFLKHPEGITIKNLPAHTKELLDLYQSISGRDDPAAMKQTIENLADPFQNNANISLSRIKKAFSEAFSSTIASAYYVTGERGSLRSISLDRDLVVWEAIR